MHDILQKSAAAGRFAHRGTSTAPQLRSGSSPSSTSSVQLRSATDQTALSTTSSDMNTSFPVPSPTSFMAPADPVDPVVPFSDPPSPPSSETIAAHETTLRHKTRPIITGTPTSPSVTSITSSSGLSSNKCRRDALDDGGDQDQHHRPISHRSASAPSTSFSGPAPLTIPKTNAGAAGVFHLAGAVSGLTSMIHNQMLTSEPHAIQQTQAIINNCDYLTSLQKSILGQFYATNPDVCGALVLQAPDVQRHSFRRVLRQLKGLPDEELEQVEIDF